MISIIIPTLNEERGLPQLLSAFPTHLKTRFDAEVIISDGGSTDSTLDVARRFGARVVQHTAGTPQTIAEARNLGATRAQGEVLVFIDADSVIPKPEHFLQRVEETMRSRKNVAATVRIEVAPGVRTAADRFWLMAFNLTFRWSNALGLGTGRGNCQIVNHDAFRQVGGYNENLVAGEDFDLFHRLGKLGHIAFLWDVTVYESPRRFRKLGYVRTSTLWFINFISVLLTKRSWSKHWHRVN
jgi:glycosyltransferase involved in cell wall biosynthesis